MDPVPYLQERQQRKIVRYLVRTKQIRDNKNVNKILALEASMENHNTKIKLIINYQRVYSEKNGVPSREK